MASHNLLVLSDVHLGSDLVHCARPDAPLRDVTNDARDDQLAALLDWYREHPIGGRPWRLVIAGDFVDFVGMSVTPPKSGTATPLDEDDRIFGLGSAEDHTIYKLRCVARRHARVFESLSRFLQAKNTVVLVRGNHDVDFHWPAVQDEFLRQLAMYGRIERGLIEFSPWFYYEEGRVFVEHGHQYDRYCSTEHVLHPVSPRDARRSSRSLSDVLLRHVVRPTRGLHEAGHEKAGPLDYVLLACRLGVKGLVGLALRFADAVRRLFGMWRDHGSAAAARIRAHHDRRMSELAHLLGVSLDRLRELAALQRAPITQNFGALASTVMLDRIALGVLGALAVAASLAVAPRLENTLLVAFAAVLVVALTSKVLGLLRKDIEPSNELRERAARVARLFPAAFVVMGHTHLPEVRSAPGSPSTYVNLGAWANADGGEGGEGGVSSRTHLVLLSDGEGAPVLAELRVWDAGVGPRELISVSDESAKRV
ncbi:MAG TPA: metallophosphoesterase [Polyangiaceae bacterium]|nr:metallophosphoesterase [Polyangiaceae bacterium]